MKSLSSNALGRTVSGLLAVSLVLLGACRSKQAEPDPGDADQQNQTPDIVRSAFQGNATAPTIVTLVPTESQNSVSRDVSVEVEFSMEMVADTLANAITVFVAGKQVQGTTVVAATNNKVTFTPAGQLPAGSEVQVVLADTVSTGNFLLAGTAWTFTTSP